MPAKALLPVWLSPYLGQPLYLWALLFWLALTVIYIVADALRVLAAHTAEVEEFVKTGNARKRRLEKAEKAD